MGLVSLLEILLEAKLICIRRIYQKNALQEPNYNNFSSFNVADAPLAIDRDEKVVSTCVWALIY